VIAIDGEHVELWTDGAAVPNPGAGGYGILLLRDGERWEFSQGYRHTTNNRMELMAVIAGLEKLPPQTRVTVYSDSKYVTDSINKGWLGRWVESGGRKSSMSREGVKNWDLWKRMHAAMSRVEVDFEWVRGHAGVAENEICDRLAEDAARSADLIDDVGFAPGTGIDATSPGPLPTQKTLW
jgi:ribonuclease HI